MDVQVRRASEADAPAASRIIVAALNDLAARQGRPALQAPDGHAAPVLRHLIQTDGARFWMAVHHDRPVGFGAGWVRGGLSFCGGLFLLPEWQGRGLGRRLFELALAGLPGPGGVTALTSSAANPVSNRLYGRHGVYPQFALLVMTGPVPPMGGERAGREAAAFDRPGLAAEPLSEAHLGAVREVDAAVLGVDRSVDHGWYLHELRNPGWLFSRGGQTAGYAYLGGDGTEGQGAVGPVAALDAADQPLMLRHAFAALASAGIQRATVIVPGPNLAVQHMLWDAGFSLGGAAGLLCASRPFAAFDRYLLSGDALM